MITSTTNSQIKWVRTLQNKRKAREAEQVFIVEGARLLGEAVQSQQRALLVLFTPDCSEEVRGSVDLLTAQGASSFAVSPSVMKSASALEHPPGILAVVAQPRHVVEPPYTFVLILDRIADPGNMGSILRSALAASVDLVLLTPGTIDLYNPKVVRGGMGAHFHLPVVQLEVGQTAALVKDLKVWAAAPGQGLPYYRVDWSEPSAILIGSEAQGLSPIAQQIMASEIHIPMSERVESLNASTAASVILFEIVRQRGAL